MGIVGYGQMVLGGKGNAENKKNGAEKIKKNRPYGLAQANAENKKKEK